MATFYDEMQKYDWESIKNAIYSVTSEEASRAIAKRESGATLDMTDFMAIISPEGEKQLEKIANLSSRITRRRFGHTMQVYVPLYLANYCSNNCVYCGFSARNKIKRSALTTEEIEAECLAIKKHPFQHILLVTGESSHHSGLEYLGNAINQIKRHFEQVSIEVQPMDTDDYKYLMDKGLHSVAVYQETYNESRYSVYHLKGRKADYRYRLETGDRLGEAGVYKISIGALLGLEDWRTEAFFVALHLRYLETKYWKTKLSISFPRLRPCAGEGFQPNSIVTERDLLLMMTAYRLMSEDVEISLSTRESPFFRDNTFKLGVTTVSAGSKTTPGGYSDYEKNKELEQFSVNDDRSVEEIVEKIKEIGLEPVWKDWSLFLQGKERSKVDGYGAK